MRKSVKTKKSFTGLSGTIKIALAAITVIATVLSMTLPKLLLHKKASHTISKVMQVPDDYYLASQTATARNASSNLSSLDRMRLIYGTWTGTMTECSTSEGFLSESEAMSMVKEQMEKYYAAGLYPISLYSDYDNWYSFDCRLYQYTDDTFETYTAYLWEMTFTRYDTKIYHKFLMSESGTILCADTNIPFSPNNDISKVYQPEDTSINIMGDSSVQILSVEKKDGHLPQLYEQIEPALAASTSIYNVSMKVGYDEPADFTIFQYEKVSNSGYCFGIVPAD